MKLYEKNSVVYFLTHGVCYPSSSLFLSCMQTAGCSKSFFLSYCRWRSISAVLPCSFVHSTAAEKQRFDAFRPYFPDLSTGVAIWRRNSHRIHTLDRGKISAMLSGTLSPSNVVEILEPFWEGNNFVLPIFAFTKSRFSTTFSGRHQYGDSHTTFRRAMELTSGLFFSSETMFYVGILNNVFRKPL